MEACYNRPQLEHAEIDVTIRCAALGDNTCGCPARPCGHATQMWGAQTGEEGVTIAPGTEKFGARLGWSGVPATHQAQMIAWARLRWSVNASPSTRGFRTVREVFVRLYEKGTHLAPASTW